MYYYVNGKKEYIPEMMRNTEINEEEKPNRGHIHDALSARKKSCPPWVLKLIIIIAIAIMIWFILCILRKKVNR
jgi:hypothetical protein